MTSSTALQSTDGLRSRNALSGIAARSSALTDDSAPPYRPKGVLITSQIKAFGINELWSREPQAPPIHHNLSAYLHEPPVRLSSHGGRVNRLCYARPLPGRILKRFSLL